MEQRQSLLELECVHRTLTLDRNASILPEIHVFSAHHVYLYYTLNGWLGSDIIVFSLSGGGAK